MKYKCVIAEDNMLERDVLEMLLKKTGMVDIVAVCKDGMEAYKAISTQHVDCVFTDVDMPQLSGIQLVSSLKTQPVFVFISGHAQYAVDAFELDVADFLLKPVLMERLLRSLEKVKACLDLREQNDGTYHQLPDSQADHFYVRVQQGMARVDYADITHIESSGNFSKIHTVQGVEHLTLVSLKSFLEQLPGDWIVRVHRQYLVNIGQVKQIDAASVKVGNQRIVPLSPPYRQDVLDRISAKVIHR